MSFFTVLPIDLKINKMKYCGDFEDLYKNFLNKEEIVGKNIILEVKFNTLISQLREVEKVYLKIIIEKLREEYKSKIGFKIINESIEDILDIIDFSGIDFIVLDIDKYRQKDIDKLKEQLEVVALYNL